MRARYIYLSLMQHKFKKKERKKQSKKVGGGGILLSELTMKRIN